MVARKKLAKKLVSKGKKKANAAVAKRAAKAKPKPKTKAKPKPKLKPKAKAKLAAKPKPAPTVAPSLAKPKPAPKPAAPPPAPVPPAPAGVVSADEVTLENIFALRNRAHAGFKPNAFQEAKRVLVSERYATIDDAARAVAEKAIEISNESHGHEPFERH